MSAAMPAAMHASVIHAQADGYSEALIEKHCSGWVQDEQSRKVIALLVKQAWIEGYGSGTQQACNAHLRIFQETVDEFWRRANWEAP